VRQDTLHQALGRSGCGPGPAPPRRQQPPATHHERLARWQLRCTRGPGKAPRSQVRRHPNRPPISKPRTIERHE
jgi:hypothetical protein